MKYSLDRQVLINDPNSPVWMYSEEVGVGANNAGGNNNRE